MAAGIFFTFFPFFHLNFPFLYSIARWVSTWTAKHKNCSRGDGHSGVRTPKRFSGANCLLEKERPENRNRRIQEVISISTLNVHIWYGERKWGKLIIAISLLFFYFLSFSSGAFLWWKKSPSFCRSFASKSFFNYRNY
jgi:hypothetical protein